MKLRHNSISSLCQHQNNQSVLCTHIDIRIIPIALSKKGLISGGNRGSGSCLRNNFRRLATVCTSQDDRSTVSPAVQEEILDISIV